MENNQRLSTVFSLVMLVATATLGWMSFNNRDIPRVADIRISAQVPPDEQNVVARLWEDPLQAVQTELSKRSQNKLDAFQTIAAKHDLPSMASAVFEKASTRKICFLVVPIPDTPFPGDMEVRLRLRYAVQMALAEENYAPDNRNYLGYFMVKTESSSSGPLAVNSGAFIPYEWFLPRRISSGPEKDPAVLVLWLPESLLSRDPLGILGHLRHSLCVSKEVSLPEDKFLGFSVIGPRSSDTLKKMISAGMVEGKKEAKDRRAALGYLRNKLAIFSPQSTTPDALLELKPEPFWPNARKDFARMLEMTFTGKSDGFNTPGVPHYFYNFIAPDDQLTDLLAVELRLRGIRIDKDNDFSDKILLLTEADTAYGRSLPIAMKASL